VRIRGALPLIVAGRPVAITGGPFDALPDGAFGVCLEPEAAKAWLADVALPIPDFGVPAMADLKRAVGLVLAQLAADPARPVHVGCRAGIGRTGLFLACLARATGIAGDPIAFVRARYHPDAAETPDQERMARDFAWP
jgi:protein-tyrosine phosphatase